MLQEIPILISHVKDIIRGDYRYIRFFWDQFITGRSIQDTWSLDINLAEHILPKLRIFRTIEFVYPACFNKAEEWNIILDKMIFAFEEILKDSYYCEDIDEEKINEGLELFGQYYRSLWW